MEHPVFLTANNLRIGYAHKGRENCLFEALDLSLYAGEMICFMGPNGAGKSSLLRTLAGLQKPLSGEVRILSAAHKQTAQQIAVVLTDRINQVNLTVEEIVTFGRYPYLGWNVRISNEDRKIIQSAIERVHLDPIRNQKVYELSDGQLQMVMIARALAQETPIILLDEPTAHLDLNNRLEIMNLLRDLSRQTEKAILVATHELDLALQTADRIWLTGKNRDLLQGLPEDLVLNDAFDDIFRFKGFDLKTGKVKQHAWRNLTVQLVGEGPTLLWTRNALERNGYQVSETPHAIRIELVPGGESAKWIVIRDDRDEASEIAESIESLLKLL